MCGLLPDSPTATPNRTDGNIHFQPLFNSNFFSGAIENVLKHNISIFVLQLEPFKPCLDTELVNGFAF